MLYDVYILRAIDPDVLEYVCRTSADWGEIVASLQVLYSDMVGVQIEPAKGDE